MTLEKVKNLISDLRHIFFCRPAWKLSFSGKSSFHVLILCFIHSWRFDILLEIFTISALKTLIFFLGDINHVKRGTVVTMILLSAICALYSCTYVPASVAHNWLFWKILHCLANIHPLILLFIIKCSVAGFEAILMEIELYIS